MGRREEGTGERKGGSGRQGGGEVPALEGQQRLRSPGGHSRAGQEAGQWDLKQVLVHGCGAKSALRGLGHSLPTLTGSLWLGALTFGVGEAPESRRRLQL